MEDKKLFKTEKSSFMALPLQIVGLMAVISGLFGVGYQKGMIITMNLGNLSGSYEIREVFNSAVLGYLHVFSAFKLDTYWTVVINHLTESIFLPIILITLGLLFPLVNRNEDKIKNYFLNVIVTPKSIRKKVFKSFIWSPLVLITTVYSLIFSAFMVFYMVPLLIAFFVLPTLLGYVAGEDFVEKAMKKEFCVSITKELLKKGKLRQCTQVSIKGKTITAKVFLENNDAYFLRRNNAFLYMTKDGNNCIYSIYVNSEDVKDDHFKFVDKEIQGLCNSETERNQKEKIPAKFA